MAKASDLMNKSGSAGFGSPLPQPAPEATPVKEELTGAARPPERGHGPDVHAGKGGKAKGGGGGSSARPKV
ncbi:MAG: hypothetical protein SFY69_10990 [Planctomycetota bacterium]|nr:hypothetical protein [Planctomycetota bacterium]